MTVFAGRKYDAMKPRLCFENRLFVTVATVLIVVFAVGTACEPGGESPSEVVDEFLDHLRYGEQERALQNVWPPTHRKLVAAHDGLEEYFDGELPLERSEMLVVTRIENPMVITRIRPEQSVPEQPSDADSVTMKLEFRDGRTGRIPVRYSADDGRWYVDLPVDDRRSLRVLDESAGGDDAPNSAMLDEMQQLDGMTGNE